MNVAQALEHANALVFPEIVYCGGFSSMDAERQKNEEALATLREEFAKNDNPGFGYDVILDLADRNRELCDQMGIERLNNTRDSSLARGMSDQDLCAGVAALQKRKASTVIREVGGDRNNLGVAYVTKPIRGTVLGIDIETTDRYPDRGYIVNVGFEIMELTADAEPHDAEAHFCGIPDMYAEKGVPLERIHHIGWADVAGKTPFRQDKKLQAKLLRLMKKYPYMAHNAAFEDSWFTLHLEGYATPGHSRGSACYRIGPDAFFSGDSLVPGFAVITRLRGQDRARGHPRHLPPARPRGQDAAARVEPGLARELGTPPRHARQDRG